jgi:hypothetical protein
MKVPNISEGCWFQFLMALFRKECFLIFFFVSCPYFSEHDQPYSNTKSFATCRVLLSKPVPKCKL